MIKTIIIGKKSNLSKYLKQELGNCKIFSSREIAKNFDKFEKNLNKYQNINLIINSFYPSFLLNNLKSRKKFKKISTENNKKILEKLRHKKINKIIYSSSASVNNIKKQFIMNNDKFFYTKAKYDLENFLFKLFKNDHKKIIIARIFNMYGGNDKFSIIARLIKCYKKKKTFVLNNNGHAKRDFIHVKDVAKIYFRLLQSDLYGIHDIGTGKSTQIYDLIKILGIRNFKIRSNMVNEEQISKAKIKQSHKKIFISKIKVKKFLKQKLNLT